MPLGPGYRFLSRKLFTKLWNKIKNIKMNDISRFEKRGLVKKYIDSPFCNQKHDTYSHFTFSYIDKNVTLIERLALSFRYFI